MVTFGCLAPWAGWGSTQGREKPGERECSDLVVKESGVASLNLLLFFLFFAGVVGSTGWSD